MVLAHPALSKKLNSNSFEVILSQGVLRRASKLFWRSSGRTTLQVTKLFAVLQVLMGELFGHKW